MRFLVVIIILFTHLICLGQSYDAYSDKKISKKQNKTAIQAVKYWLNKNGDSLKIPKNLELPKLVFNPDEGVILCMEILEEKQNELSEKKKQEYQEGISEGNFYVINVIYRNMVGKEQSIYFSFTQNLKLKEVGIYQDEKIFYTSYPNLEQDKILKNDQ